MLRSWCCCLLILLFFVPVKAQTGDFFDSEEILRLTLQSDWQSLREDRPDSATYQIATISYLGEKAQYQLQAKVKLRGNFRRRADICQFPPIRLKVSKEVAPGTPFQGNRKLKVVTHCRQENWVLREYMVYKLYQKWSPHHFRVRLAQITYLEANGQSQETKYAFFIEDEDHMAERLGGTIVEDTFRLKQVNQEVLTRLMAFQYSMGNTDWNVYLQKNIRLVQPKAGGPPIPVPYDFDWASIVGTNYVNFGPNFDPRRVPRTCLSEDLYLALFAQIKEEEKMYLNLISDDPHLPAEGKRMMGAYLRESFRLLRQKRTLQRVFLAGCEE
ncbi:MAG: hypothetical protein AAF399_24800 [Bacteroidota bacterium]